MPSKIILKKSSVAAKAPVAGDLDFGELAINYTDSKLYFKKADGSIDAFVSGAASAPVTSVGGNIGAITDAQLLASIKNVDGAGSGLDADFLDGLSSASFYLASNPNGYTNNTGTVTSVGATTPLVSSGGNTPSISIPAANSTTNGFMSSAYASKLDGIAAGATANTGTVTSVGGTGTVSGLTLSGTVTGSGNLTLGGTLSLTSSNVTTALGYTPYNATNPSGYITSSASITGASRRIEFVDGPRNLTDRLPNTLARSVNWDFVSAGTGNGTGNYAGVMSFTPWDGTSASTGDSSYQLAFANQSGVNASGPARLSIRNGINTTWNSWQEILTSSNFNSYSPSLTGTGASGTWGINITGNAANTSSISNAVGSNYTWTGLNYFRSNRNTSSDNAPLQAYSDNGSGAIMSFHRAGQYAVNFGLDSDNVIRIGGWSAAANRLQMDMSGNLTMAGNVTANSDETLKKDWNALSDSFIEDLAKVKSGTYTRIDSGERQAGSSAQDWQKLLPEVVSKSNDGILSLAYGNAALVSAIELAKRVVELEERLAKLEKLLNN